MAVSRSTVLRTTLWSIALVALLGLVAGLAAFALITRPLRGLTRAVRAFDGGDSGALAALEDGGRDSDKDGGKDGADAARGGGEIVALRRLRADGPPHLGAMARADAPGPAAP